MSDEYTFALVYRPGCNKDPRGMYVVGRFRTPQVLMEFFTDNYGTNDIEVPDDNPDWYSGDGHILYYKDIPPRWHDSCEDLQMIALQIDKTYSDDDILNDFFYM